MALGLEDLSTHADTAKVAVIYALVIEEKMTLEDADEWCETHTVLAKRKSIFRTISSLWRNEEEIDGVNYIVVKAV